MTQTTTLADARANNAVIAVQNDQFRRALMEGAASPNSPQGKVFITPGVMEHGDAFMRMALRLTADYSAFHEDSDPYGLHEMGVITVFETKVWWKIDLFDTDYRYGSDAPTGPERTRRVLTILLPSEY